MSYAILEITSVGHVWTDSAVVGQIVSYTLPVGSVLSCGGVPVSEPSPFIHTGDDTEYRIECVNYISPVTAMLSIV